MNSITFNTTANATIDATIDAKDSLSPVPILKLEGALKKQAEHAVLAVLTTDPEMERNMRDFCTTSGNQYLGMETADGHAIHYVKKQTAPCATCSKVRIVLGGLAAAGALAYTAPQVATGDPSGMITFVFLVALASLVPLTVNNSHLLGALVRKTIRR